MLRRFEFHVAGIRHHLDRTDLLKLEKREPIRARLVREPENPADPNAIKVMVSFKRLHIGYVPAGIAATLAPRLDAGEMEVAACSVFHIDSEHMAATALVKLRRL